MTSTHLLSRTPHRPRPALTILEGGVTLPLARLHECCGPGRHSFAMLVAGASRGAVFWIAPRWRGDTLNPDGMTAFTDPARFTFVTPDRAEDVLWTLEEVLRSGVVPLAVADLPAPPGLTAVRRLHLAAETGASGAGNAQDGTAPLGLILTPGEGGAPAVETRWHMAPAHDPGHTAWRLDRRRARTAPPRCWRLEGGPGAWQLTQS